MLISTICPIDNTDEFDEEVYPANFDPEDLTSDIFSARRQPDRIHYRMVRSRKSNCLRANPVLDPAVVNRLYEQSEIHHGDLAPYITDTYVHYAERARNLLPDRRGILEIGCGNGDFLSRMTTWRFDRVVGVEPSLEAVADAAAEVRGNLVCGTIDDLPLERDAFSFIAGFQVLDHLLNPGHVLQKCQAALCPGGIMLWICHDIGSPLARLLGERCPMVDIQHAVLYDKRTIAAFFIRSGFDVIEQFSVANRYPLGYWVTLSPMPEPIKGFISKVVEWTRVDRIPIKGYFGNMGIIARKPLA